MNIIIKESNFQPADNIRDYVMKRFEGIEKFMTHPTEDKVLYVDVAKISKHKSGEIYRGDVHITFGGRKYYAEAESTDPYAVIDAMREELINDLANKKSKMHRVYRKGALYVKNVIKGIPYVGKKWK